MINRAPPIVLAQKHAEHMQHCAAARISVGVEHRIRVCIVFGHDGPALPARPSRVITFLVRANVEIEKVIVSEAVFIPERLKICGKAFVQPDIRPTATGYIIAEPLMGQLVRFQRISRGVQFRARVVNHVIGLGGRTDVFHAAAKITHGGLGVLGIGIFHARLFRKELDHFRQARRRDFSFLDFATVNVRSDRDAGILARDGHKFTDYDRGKISCVRFVNLPVEGARAVRIVLRADQFAI